MGGKLTEAQSAAWLWTHMRGRTRWFGVECGHPPMSSLMSLVRKGYLKKMGSSGLPIYFERTDAGRAALSSPSPSEDSR